MTTLLSSSIALAVALFALIISVQRGVGLLVVCRDSPAAYTGAGSHDGVDNGNNVVMSLSLSLALAIALFTLIVSRRARGGGLTVCTLPSSPPLYPLTSPSSPPSSSLPLQVLRAGY